MIHENFNRFTLLLSLFVISVGLTACNLPGAELAEAADEQSVDSLPNDQPFDQANPSEFFQICEEGDGQVEQWGDGWACDFESNEDITCDAGGDCIFGTIEQPSAPGYTLKSPVLAAKDDPGNFIAACRQAGGAFIKWHAGFGCDFKENVDVFCGPEDGACGLGWVVKLAGEEAAPDNVVNPDANDARPELFAPMFQPAFIADTASADPAGSNTQAESVMAREVLLGTFQQGRPHTDSDVNEVAMVPDADEIFGELSGMADDCELAGGSATIEIDPSDPSGNSDVMVCTFPDGGGYACTPSACSPFFEGEQPDGSIDFGNFQDAFVATEVFIVLAGPSNLAPDLLGLDKDWNYLYTSLVDTNGIVAPSNLPGSVLVIGPNNIVAPNNLIGELVFSPNPYGDPMSTKECGILVPPLCYPDLPLNGLMIPETNLVYYVEVADLPMPDQFNWVEKLKPTPTGPVFKASVTPLTPVFKASVTPSPTAKNTKVLKPTAVPPTPTQVDPMNASISGTVFKDGNGDGIMNGSDIGLSGVTVRLGSGSCISTGLGSTMSSGNGSFSFTNLAAGTYCLSVDTAGSGSYSIITTTNQYTIVLSVGQSVSKKFGFQKVID